MIEIKKERQGLSFFIGGPGEWAFGGAFQRAGKLKKPEKRKKFAESIEIREQIWYTD
ncbi:MAG: hypothetical protein HFG01_07055 [Oscillibacter sp.]|nr:hypothetical protein [Oscillibacter sp.]